MAKAIKYTIMFITMWVYIFGSFGFIVHNCYMSKSVYVSNSLISAWSDMMFEKCEYNAKDFQKAEFVLSHGFIDAIVHRREQIETIASLLRIHNGGQKE